MNIERRLRNLESSGPNGYWDPVVALVVRENETKEEVIRRHFGADRPPENALVVLDIIVGPRTIPEIQ